jgi:hypothetical protein
MLIPSGDQVAADLPAVRFTHPNTSPSGARRRKLLTIEMFVLTGRAMKLKVSSPNSTKIAAMLAPIPPDPAA